MATRLTATQTVREYVRGSKERAMSAYDDNLAELDKLVLAELVEAGEAYWAVWYGEDFDWSEDSESEPERKAFEHAYEALGYLAVEVDHGQELGVENPDGSMTYY